MTSLPGLTVEAKRPRSGSGRLSGRRRYTDTTGSCPRRGAVAVAPLLRGLAGSARTSQAAPGCGGRSAAGTMSQRQVLQGRGCGGRSHTGGGSQGLSARPAPPCLSPQCSSSTRKPEPSSCRWWQSWRPDPKTSRPCRMRVSPRLNPSSPAVPGLCHLVPRFCPAPPVVSRPGSSALLCPSLHPLPVAALCPRDSPSPGSPVPGLNSLFTPPSYPTPIPCHGSLGEERDGDWRTASLNPSSSLRRL